MNTTRGSNHNARRAEGRALRSSKSGGGCLGIRAFTLLEILVSMTILAIMGAALFTMFHQSTRTWMWADARTQQFVAGREALGLIASELRQAVVDPNANSSVQGASFWGQDDKNTIGDYKEGEVYYDQIDFVAPTEMHSSGAKQDLCVIGYWADDDPNDPDPDAPRILMRRCIDDTDNTRWSQFDMSPGGESNELGVKVRLLTFEYWNGSEWDWTDRGTHQCGGGLPKAVRITLVVADPMEPKNKEKDKTFTTVVLLNTSE
jgi:prepilin-type N-terminal cleavage/methylation domain-containing protein